MKTAFLILFLSLASICHAVDSFESYFHWIEPKTRVIISWNAVPNVSGYQIEIVKMETNKSVMSIHVTNPSYPITFNTDGHYIARERSFTLVNGTRVYGEWQTSLNGLVMLNNSLITKPWIVIVPRR